jgi:hypothetical protein
MSPCMIHWTVAQSEAGKAGANRRSGDHAVDPGCLAAADKNRQIVMRKSFAEDSQRFSACTRSEDTTNYCTANCTERALTTTSRTVDEARAACQALGRVTTIVAKRMPRSGPDFCTLRIVTSPPRNV